MIIIILLLRVYDSKFLLPVTKKAIVFIFAYLLTMNTSIRPAAESRQTELLRLANSFDLDVEDISWKQFLIAEKENHVIGFGRLRKYSECTEVATVGVIEPERHKGIGTSLVKELIRMGPEEVYVVCVIPYFFSHVGFHAVKQYPSVLQKKVDFCKLYNFTDEQIFVMCLRK